MRKSLQNSVTTVSDNIQPIKQSLEEQNASTSDTFAEIEALRPDMRAKWYHALKHHPWLREANKASKTNIV
jgi:hypothetical protein